MAGFGQDRMNEPVGGVTGDGSDGPIVHEPPAEFRFRDLDEYPADVVSRYRLDNPLPQQQRGVWEPDREPEDEGYGS